MQGLRDGFGREFHVDAGSRRQLAAKYRALRPELSRYSTVRSLPALPAELGARLGCGCSRPLHCFLERQRSLSYDP